MRMLNIAVAGRRRVVAGSYTQLFGSFTMSDFFFTLTDLAGIMILVCIEKLVKTGFYDQ